MSSETCPSPSGGIIPPMKMIARIRTDLPEKFGIPRQSGLAPHLLGRVIFEEPYRNAEALRGLEGFDYLWLLWVFSANLRDTWSPTVRPPRLGGNARLGVFATRSPFRPNPIGLSSVKLEAIESTAEYGLTLLVSGADLMDGTPILDIKPYIPYTDAHPDAAGGFATEPDKTLAVVFPPEMLCQLPRKNREGVIEVLAQDPRPHYHQDPGHVYGLYYGGWNIRFSVRDNVLTVSGVEKMRDPAE